MSLSKAYYYLFYKFYNLAKSSPTIFPYDYVAAIMIAWIEILIWGCARLYYSEIVGQFDYSPFISFEVLIPFAIIAFAKYWLFFRNDKWKKYLNEFDKLPKDKNENGTLIIIGLILFVIINFAIAVHLSPIIK